MKPAPRRTPSVTIGGVQLQSGWYLASNTLAPVQKRPKKKDGYAHFDGEVLTLVNYKYVGGGYSFGPVAAGIDLSNATIELVFKGENIIDVTGTVKSAALMVNDGKVTVRGKGTLALYAQGGALCNFGMLGTGTVHLTSGTIKLRASVGSYRVGEEGKRIYQADSYAVKLGKLVARAARIRGDDLDEENKTKGKRLDDSTHAGINELNRNNETEVVIDFPRAIFWWWRRGCLLPGLLLLVALLSVIVTIIVVTRDPQVYEPDFNLLDVDPNVEEMQDTGDPVESVGGGGSVVLNFSYDVAVDLGSKTASLYFGLPSQSNKDAVLQLIVNDLLVAQSGRLPPGHQVSTLTVNDDAAARLQQGGYNGVLRVLYYNDQTGERAILDTEIEVTVTVME